MTTLTRRAVIGCALALAADPAFAQKGWPSGPLHVYVGVPSGSSPDTPARIATSRWPSASGGLWSSRTSLAQAASSASSSCWQTPRTTT